MREINIIFKSVFLLVLAIFISSCEDGGCKTFNPNSLDNSSKLVSVEQSVYVSEIIEKITEEEAKGDSKNEKIIADLKKQLIGFRGYHIAEDMNLSVTKDRVVRIRISDGGIYEEPQKYRVMVRADNRFEKPAVYIAKFDGTNYVPDWKKIEGDDQAKRIENLLLRHKDGRSERLIKVYEGDVVNFSLIDAVEFYKGISQEYKLSQIFNSGEIDFSHDLTEIGQNADNVLISTTDKSFICGYDSPICEKKEKLFFNLWQGYNPFKNIGTPEEQTGAVACSSENPTKCIYRYGMGLGINISDGEEGGDLSLYKRELNFFVPTRKPSASAVKYVYYLKSRSDGLLDFSLNNFNNDFIIDKTLPEYPIVDATLKSPPETYNELYNKLTDNSYSINRYLLGRFMMDVEIASSTGADSRNKINRVKTAYAIIKDGIVKDLSAIVNTSQTVEFNAKSDGNLYFLVENDFPSLKGNYVVSAQAYNKSAEISDFFFNTIIKPIKQNMMSTAAIMFASMSSTGKFAYFLQGLVTIYIMMQGFLFAMGSLKVTAMDLTGKIIKLVAVSILLTENSFKFFHDYLFVFFLKGTDQLIGSVSNATSQIGNPLGFIDPMVHKYLLNDDLWFILWNYVLFFGYGYIVPGIVIMISIFMLLYSLGRIIVGYVLAFVCMSVMIALGPIFITFILFDYTRQYFNQWISIMLGYVIQPTLIIILVLFIDQISSDMLAKALLPVCHHCFLPVNLNIPFPFGLMLGTEPLFCVEGYAPKPINTPVIFLLRNAMLFYLIVKLLHQVVQLSTVMTDMLTGGASGLGASSLGGSANFDSGFVGEGMGYLREKLLYQRILRMSEGRAQELSRIGLVGVISKTFKRRVLGIDYGESMYNAQLKEAEKVKKEKENEFNKAIEERESEKSDKKQVDFSDVKPQTSEKDSKKLGSTASDSSIQGDAGSSEDVHGESKEVEKTKDSQKEAEKKEAEKKEAEKAKEESVKKRAYIEKEMQLKKEIKASEKVINDLRVSIENARLGVYPPEETLFSLTKDLIKLKASDLWSKLSSHDQGLVNKILDSKNSRNVISLDKSTIGSEDLDSKTKDKKP